MTHEQLIAKCFQWHWNNFPHERQMLFGVNNNSIDWMDGAKNKAKGVVAGVYDFAYILPKNIVFLDGKVGNDRLSSKQIEFSQKIEDRGFMCITFSSLEEFQEIIRTLQNSYYV